jgi:hypothetical protein
MKRVTGSVTCLIWTAAAVAVIGIDAQAATIDRSLEGNYRNTGFAGKLRNTYTYCPVD